jgi:hypothetical protein
MPQKNSNLMDEDFVLVDLPDPAFPDELPAGTDLLATWNDTRTDLPGTIAERNDTRTDSPGTIAERNDTRTDSPGTIAERNNTIAKRNELSLAEREKAPRFQLASQTSTRGFRLARDVLPAKELMARSPICLEAEARGPLRLEAETNGPKSLAANEFVSWSR